MAQLGYGGREEQLYLQAYDFAKQGKPTLIFSFESSLIKFTKGLASHVLKIPVSELDLGNVDLQKALHEPLKAHFSVITEASMSLSEIEEAINENKKTQGITHVVLDRVEDKTRINAIARSAGVQVYY
ncbi:hypothetical protein ACFX4N_24155 [Priestia sp. YIM B13551]|uniref:hypothetical protein n=1 Tax=Priestia sp. YIM B13551 TaxID=3366306 RepID=UPI0036730284